jgi:DNA-directed RNA polymerase specialized sigma24 family protein
VEDAYSVQGAAEVLGIPEARVWELMARGVLAGSQAADGSWRV